MNLAILWLLIRRQWRTNSLPLLALAVMIAVGSLSTVMLLTNRMQQAVNQQTSETLGADVIIKSIEPIPESWISKAQQLNLRYSTATIFPTMVSYVDTLQLAALKAVDANYPLYPGLITEPAIEKNPIAATITSGNVWLDPILLSDLGAKLGDHVQIGTANFTIAGVIKEEPDRGWQFINFSPRVLMAEQDLASTQLIQPGGNINYQLSLAGGAKALHDFSAWIKPQLASSQQIISLADTQPQLHGIIQRLQTYLSLVALFAVGLAGIAIAVVARHYTRQQYDICALFRCLGASQTWYLYWQFAVLLMVGIIAAILGGVIGYFTHFAVLQALMHWLGSLGSLPAANVWLVVVSGMQGIIILLAFALPPLLRLREVSPLRLLRKDLTPPSASVYLTYIFAVVALVGLLIWQTQQVWISIKLMSIIFASILVLLPLLYFIIKSIVKSVEQRKHTYLFVHLLSLRSQLGNASVQVIATTLVLTLLILLQSLRSNLLEEWQGQLPENTPNQFLVNIIPDQVEPIRALLAAHHLPIPNFYPIVAGRLIARNGKPLLLSDYPPDEAPNALRRALQLTWTQQLPVDNIVTAGTWQMTTGFSPTISMDEKVAAQLNIQLNDQVTFMIGEREITLPVTSMRKIEWGSFQPNFFVIFTPGVLDNFPHTYITSFYFPAASSELRQQFHHDFPNVALIDIGALINNAQTLLASASQAIEMSLLFSLAAAVVVLITIFYTSFQQRYLTNAILRSLGANSKQLISAVLIEYAILALLSGAIAIILINAAWWWLANYIFDFAYQFQFATAFYTLFISFIIYGFMGFFGALRLIKPSAQQLLTSELS